MIEFKKLEISNFLSIGQAEVDLTTQGFTLISAVNNRVEDNTKSNGSGKSSIFEALVWVITGETLRGNKNIINRYTNGDCLVKVDFSFKGFNWSIKRGMSKDKEKSLEIYKNGALLESKGYRDSEEVLSRELPELTFKFINSVIVLGQGLPGRFTNNTPSGRKAVLEELTNADYMITQIKDSIKTRGSLLSSKLRESQDRVLASRSLNLALNDQLSEYERELDFLKSFDVEKAKLKLEELVDDGKKANSEYSRLKALTEEAKADIDLFNSKILDNNTKKSEKVSKIELTYNERVLEISKKYETKILEATSDLQERVTTLRLDKDKITSSISHSEALITGGYCKQCGRRFDNISEEDILEAKKSIDTNKSRLLEVESQILGCSKDKDSKKSSLESECREEISKVKKEGENEISKVRALFDVEGEVFKTELCKNRAKYSELEKMANEAYSKLTDLRVTYKLENQKLEDFNKKYSELESKITKTKLSISDNTEVINSGIRTIEELENRLKINKSMDTFASRDFRGILLEGVILRLDSILKTYSRIVYGNELTSFHLDGNSIEVEFDDKDYESLSGGEKQKLDLLIQLSLRDLMIELNGIVGSFLVIDEGFDGLDRIGSEKVINLFQSLQTSVYVITHRSDELQVPYDQEIVVVKDPDGVSHLEVGI